MVTVCIDSDPIPPAQIKRDARGKKIIPIKGISIDIVRAAFLYIGQQVEFIGDLPWKRCLKEVETGTIDFALGVYMNKERVGFFDYSIHYNTLTPQIFHLASTPITITQLSDLKKYRGCGIYGSSYAHYELEPKDLDLGNDYDSLYRKLLARRCDYFTEEIEAIYESNSGKEFLLNPLVVHEPVPMALAPARHLVTAKNGPNSSKMDQINSALEYLIRSGQVEQFWKKDMGNLTYKP